MKYVILIFGFLFLGFIVSAQKKMMYGDTSRKGIPFSKDPHVIKYEETRLTANHGLF